MALASFRDMLPVFSDDKHGPSSDATPLLGGDDSVSVCASAVPSKVGGEPDAQEITISMRIADKAYAHTKECMISSCVVFTILGVCVIFYFFCIPCLLGVLAVSMCLCPFIPYFNIPLWISLLILLMSGWNLTRGHFSIVWG